MYPLLIHLLSHPVIYLFSTFGLITVCHEALSAPLSGMQSGSLMAESAACVKRVKTSRLHLVPAEKSRPMLGVSAEPISRGGQPAINP